MKKQFAVPLVLLMIVMSGCITTQQNPIHIAETPEQKAFALYGTYVNVREAAGRYVQGPSANDYGIKLVRATDKAVNPLAEALNDSAKAYRVARTSVGATATGEQIQAYQEAAASLDKAYNESYSAIHDMIDLVVKLISGE